MFKSTIENPFLRSMITLIATLLLFSSNFVSSVSMNRPIVNMNPKKITSLISETGVFLSVKRDVNRLILGAQGFYDLFQRSIKASQKKKQHGEDSLTYSEYRLIETRNDDLLRIFRLVAYLPFSPELFLYGNVIMPFISLNKSPWTWKTYPSTFTYPDEVHLQHEILQKRRIQLLVNGVSWLKTNLIDDASDKYRRFMLSEDLERIEKVFQSKSITTSLESLEPLYAANDVMSIKKLKIKMKLDADLSGFTAWGCMKDMMKATGHDGVPNVPVLRRLNRGNISKYVDKVRKHDRFIDKIGVNALNNEELQEVCRERFISTHDKTENQLRSSVSQWLDHTVKSFQQQESEHGRYLVNEQNKRLVLMGLNLYDDFKTHPFASTYREMMKP